MLYLGLVEKVRDDVLRPISLDLISLGDGALSIGWTMVSIGAWVGIAKEQIKPGLQCLVWRTGYSSSDDLYRVISFFPDANTPLPDNRRAIARQGHPVAITGSPKLTSAQTIASLGGVLITPLYHDLVGSIIED